MATVPFAHVEHGAPQQARVTTLAQAPQANAFLAALGDGALALVEDAAAAPVRARVDGRVLHAGFLADGRVAVVLLGAAEQALAIEVWRADLGERLAREVLPPAPRPEALRCEHVRVSGSGRYVAVDHAVYDRHEARWLPGEVQHGHQTALEVVGEHAVVSGGFWDARVLVRALPSGAQETFALDAHILAASYHPSLARVYAGTEAGVMSVHVGSKATQRFGRVGKVDALHVVAEARALAVLAEGKLWLLDASTLRERTALDLAADDARTAVDGTWLAVADARGRVHVVDVAAGRVLGSDTLVSGPIEALAVSRRMQSVVVAARAGGGSVLARASLAR